MNRVHDETNRECPREDANGHRIDQDGKLVYDERCHNCDAPKEKQDWETLIDEQIDSIDEGLAIKKDEPNRLGIYTSATNLGTRKIEIKSIIRKEKELSKEEGRREGHEEGWWKGSQLGEEEAFNAAINKILNYADEASYEAIAVVEGYKPISAAITLEDLHAICASLKTNSK